MNNITIDDMLDNALSKIQPKSKKEKDAAIDKRNKGIAFRYFGLDGKPRLSMQETGEHFGGLTRESIRQITNKIAGQIKEYFGSTARVSACIDQISKGCPTSSEKIKEMMISCGFIHADSPLSPESVLTLAEILGIKSKIPAQIVHGNNKYIVLQSQKNLAKEIESIAISQISHNGAVTIKTIYEKCSMKDGKKKMEFIEMVVNGLSGLIWASKELSLFYFVGRGRNRFLTRVEMMFSIFSEVNLDNIQEGIDRSWKKNFEKDTTRLLTTQEIELILLSTGSFHIDENKVVTQISENANKKGIRPLEMKMVKEIAASEKGYMHEKKLEDIFVKEAKEKWNFSIALNYSPLIYKKSRGKYANVGKLKPAI